MRPELPIPGMAVARMRICFLRGCFGAMSAFGKKKSRSLASHSIQGFGGRWTGKTEYFFPLSECDVISVFSVKNCLRIGNYFSRFSEQDMAIIIFIFVKMNKFEILYSIMCDGIVFVEEFKDYLARWNAVRVRRSSI